MAYKIFLDTNILADHLLDRNEHSSSIISLVEAGQLRGYASSASFFTLAYIIEGRLKLKAKPILQKINQFIDVIPTEQVVLDQSYSSAFQDMEDAFQYFTALHETGLDFFVTNNTKDYKTSLAKLPVVSAKDLMGIISKEL